MKNSWYRKVFWIVLFAGMAVDSFFDFFAYRAWHNSVGAIGNNWIVSGSALDFGLFAIAAAIWLISEKLNKKDRVELTNLITKAQRTNQELQEMIELRSRQLQSTVHDLKNPLGSIKGYSDLIEEESTNAETVNEMAHALQRISSHTLELVNSLMETNTNQLTNKPTRINLVTLTEEVRNAFLPQLKAKRQTLTCRHQSQELALRAEPRKIHDLLTNLIGNAIKFSDLDSQITIETKATTREAVITIDDCGPGFTKEDKEKAFGRFQKLSAKPTGGEVSSGLGLSLCRETIEAYKGTLEIQDNPAGRGARLKISLPLEAQPQRAERQFSN